MMQLDWISAEQFATPPTRISRQNEHGVLEVLEVLRINDAGCRGLRHCAIELAFDGQTYHWAVSVYGLEGGLGFAPSPHWRHSAATRDHAVLDAAAEIRKRLPGVYQSKDQPPKFARQIFEWLDNILSVEPIAPEPWGEEAAA